MKEVNTQFADKSSVKIAGRTFLGTTALLVAGASQAAIEIAPIVAELKTDGIGAISAVGVGLLALAGVAVVFKWVKAAFF